jgi:hypothetical protein
VLGLSGNRGREGSLRLYAAIFGIVALAGVSAPAFAAQWEEAGETAGGNPVYVDISSMRIGGAVRTAWIRVVYRQPIQAGNVRAASMEALAHFDCSSGENAGLRVMLYEDEDGQKLALAREERETRFGVEPEGSIGRIAHARICRD